MSIEQDWAATAEECIKQQTDAGLLYAELAGQEDAMEVERVKLKAQLIDALMGTHNEQTKRDHSADSAEKAASCDPRYLAHVLAKGEVVVRKNKAKALQESARLRAKLATVTYKVASRSGIV